MTHTKGLRKSSKTVKIQKAAKCSRKSKAKKSTDANTCCLKCGKYNKEEKTCSIDGKSVEEDEVCKSFDRSAVVRCDRCGREVIYKSMADYNDSVIHFSMESRGGSSSGQNVHLCRKCSHDAFELFHELLENVRKENIYYDVDDKQKRV